MHPFFACACVFAAVAAARAVHAADSVAVLITLPLIEQRHALAYMATAAHISVDARIMLLPLLNSDGDGERNFFLLMHQACLIQPVPVARSLGPHMYAAGPLRVCECECMCT